MRAFAFRLRRLLTCPKG